MATEVTEAADKKVEAPERIWVDVREGGFNDYDPGCNAQWMDATDWKPADDGENESDWALYIRAGTPSDTRQRAERAARRIAKYALDSSHHVGYLNKVDQLAAIIAAEFEK